MMMKLRRSLGRHWHIRDFAIAIILTVIGIFLTRDAWIDIIQIAYGDEEASHIFLVPIVAVWMAWVRKARWRQCYPVGRWVGPIMIALGWFSLAYGYTNQNQSLWHAGSLVVVVGCIVSTFGINVVRQFLPAFLVLIFIVPVPGYLRQQISMPMQEITAIVSEATLQTVGIPVVRSGNLLSIEDHQVTVAEACNGLRMVFALVLVSYAFAFGTGLRQYVRFLIIAASPITAILCNVIRLLPTIWMYGYGDHNLAGKFHDWAGWVMLVVAFLILMGLVRVLRWALLPITPYPLAQS